MWSPTILLTQPTYAWLPSSDGIGYFHMGMTEGARRSCCYHYVLGHLSLYLFFGVLFAHLFSTFFFFFVYIKKTRVTQLKRNLKQVLFCYFKNYKLKRQTKSRNLNLDLFTALLHMDFFFLFLGFFFCFCQRSHFFCFLPTQKMFQDMKDACKGGDVEKVKKLLQKSPYLLNERLDEVLFFFFFFWFMVELFHGIFCCYVEGYFIIMMFLSLILCPFLSFSFSFFLFFFFSFLFFSLVILPSIMPLGLVKRMWWRCCWQPMLTSMPKRRLVGY